MKNKLHVKTGDTVVVLSGKSKGKKGKVLQVSPAEGKVIVEGVQIVSKHVKPRKMGDPGGIIKAESALYASKVALYCTKCQKATRVAHKFVKDGDKEKRIRVCCHCGEVFE